MNNINLDGLSDINELQATLTLHTEAKGYLQSFDWCVKTKNAWYDRSYSIYDKICVFLFEIEPINDSVDDFIWVIVGDLPSVYLDKSVATAQQALTTYCDLMNEWADNILNGQSIEECYPVVAQPTTENAKLLKSRTAFIKRELLMTSDE